MLSREEVAEKIFVFIRDKYHGSHNKAFAAFDVDKDGGLDRTELDAFLTAAEVGTALGRWLLIRFAMREADANHDGRLTVQEVFSITAPPKSGERGKSITGQLSLVSVPVNGSGHVLVSVWGVGGHDYKEEELFVDLNAFRTTVDGCPVESATELVRWIDGLPLYSTVTVTADRDPMMYGAVEECKFLHQK